MDITNREAIEQLVNAFYDKVKRDDTIGYIFQQAIGADWSHHLPIMYSFWEMVLLNKAGYSGNPVQKHVALDRMIRLEEKHFQRWIELWDETVDQLFTGPVADEAKKRASLMMNLIRMKVDWGRGKNSIG